MIAELISLTPSAVHSPMTTAVLKAPLLPHLNPANSIVSMMDAGIPSIKILIFHVFKNRKTIAVAKIKQKSSKDRHSDQTSIRVRPIKETPERIGIRTPSYLHSGRFWLAITAKRKTSENALWPTATPVPP
ncbi:hypothetical protein ACIPI6_02200 [Pseudomonas protegens]|uniref:hypothetical protein n=1 Tax=Pseudomonas protegens TaxID=380021 RepID=UPI0011A148B5